MKKTNKSKKVLVAAVLMMSMAFSGLASAADMKTIKKDGMELVQLRQAAKMYDYSIMWDGKDRSVTLMYMGKMDGMMKDDKMMEDDMKMKDDKMMEDDKMMNDDMMMEDTMMPAGKTIKLWIGSKKIMVDGMQVNLKSMPVIHDGNTYAAESVIQQYMMPAMGMK
ncbi:stalk domain-containing protein [Paenibacillus sp. 1781tsa1]|uniref:stalk domain-containing protein n=1 Tax=Paenibacillus sp. 1781tsa1 TaxID=2953810 RepID=UPI00209F60D9|nr:stalk domain-containing protein [Paenibacillus sp. 1781tsa1]MCP1183800.1 stalk domain-containing protein [Paenibacillus sp. 1781tsa1]